MLNSIDRIAKEGRQHKLATTKKVCREGGFVKGHWRHYANHSIWIEATEKVAYQVRIAK